MTRDISETPEKEAGFTLIESMVALVILGIAAVGIVQAVEAHVDRLRALDQRTAARWVAENALAEARLQAASGTIADSRVERPMLQYRWSVATALTPSEDPDMRLATITVMPQGSANSVVTLRGFVDSGTVTP
ncbi:MAG: type II secretion system minor pseudopilin GspI [Pontixanthobacter sp.]